MCLCKILQLRCSLGGLIERSRASTIVNRTPKSAAFPKSIFDYFMWLQHQQFAIVIKFPSSELRRIPNFNECAFLPQSKTAKITLHTDLITVIIVYCIWWEVKCPGNCAHLPAAPLVRVHTGKPLLKIPTISRLEVVVCLVTCLIYSHIRMYIILCMYV